MWSEVIIMWRISTTVIACLIAYAIFSKPVRKPSGIEDLIREKRIYPCE
jgi:hypothetical protein